MANPEIDFLENNSVVQYYYPQRYTTGKFGIRALLQGLARAYSKDGVHIVHVRPDCDLDVPVMCERYGDN